MTTLDLKDRKILYELDFNARQTDSEIAKKVKLSREVVSYRISRLIKKGIIKNFVTILNHNALGYLAFRIYFKFREVSKEKEDEIVGFLKDKVAWLVRVRGNWSFNCMIFTTNVFELEKFINSLKKRFQKNLLDTHFSLITRIIHYRRGYLLDKKQDTSRYDVMGEVVNTVTLDDTDLNILDAVQNNARLSSIEIANKIRISERVVRYRMKNLIKNKVILGFRSILNLEKLGISYYKIHFKLNRYDETIKKIDTYIHLHPRVIYKTETIGGWDLELEVQVPSSKDLYAFIDGFTRDFTGLIDDYEIVEYDKEYKLSYLNKL
ncbi:Lrp/AsnC family transcriptional regulator [Nanoarchaeota archaeon]